MFSRRSTWERRHHTIPIRRTYGSCSRPVGHLNMTVQHKVFVKFLKNWHVNRLIAYDWIAKLLPVRYIVHYRPSTSLKKSPTCVCVGRKSLANASYIGNLSISVAYPMHTFRLRNVCPIDYCRYDGDEAGHARLVWSVNICHSYHESTILCNSGVISGIGR